MGGCADGSWHVAGDLPRESSRLLHHNTHHGPGPAKYVVVLRGIPIRLLCSSNTPLSRLLPLQLPLSVIVLFGVLCKHIPRSAIDFRCRGMYEPYRVLGIDNWLDGLFVGVYKIQFRIFCHVNGNQRGRITLVLMFYTRRHIELNKWKSKYD